MVLCRSSSPLSSFHTGRPYVRKLHTESKALAGMMSLLPAEVNIEEHIKVVVLGFSKDRIGEC